METIGKYQVLSKIGSGGFAVVYKGYDPFIKRPVAIKVCHARDEETRKRFYREAEIAGRLVHRNITTVYDFGLQGETPYLVEEYLSGEDLAHVIARREPETLEEKLDILIQAASGLAYAHTQGVIHRDVKPANVRVLDSGLVKIMDFGTAKLTGTESKLTQTGMTLGTVAYLAPERLEGRSAAPTADLFSFGVLAYELLAFARPFVADNIPQVIEEVLKATPRAITEHWPNCPPQLATLVERCLEKEPAARYPSCAVLIDELVRFRDEHTGFVRLPLGAIGDAGSSASLSRQQLAPRLVERARELVDSGKVHRAAVLLEEVLELDPDHPEARRLATACETASGEVETPSRATAVEESRQRQLAEAVASIERSLAAGGLRQAAAALGFAVQLYGKFPQTIALRHRIVDEVRARVQETRRDAGSQARQIVATLRALLARGRLTPTVGETLVRYAEELDPSRKAARSVVDELRRAPPPAVAPPPVVAAPPAPPATPAAPAPVIEPVSGTMSVEELRKRIEAVKSIERLIAEGKAEMAERALVFAVRMFGDFEQANDLRRRIARAREP